MPDAPSITDVIYDQSAPILDREQIDMLLMGEDDEIADTSLAAELFELFSAESSKKLEALPDVCARGDVLQLRNILHFIAGSAGNLGLVRLSAFYRGIERAIDQNLLSDISELRAPICQEFEIARSAFRVGFGV
jgi:HPt (histidine-containing phosphotransfer) domain-containing protein